MRITSQQQVFFDDEASRLHGSCACDGSGDCAWCQTYYGQNIDVPEIRITADDDGLWIHVGDSHINLTCHDSPLIRRGFDGVWRGLRGANAGH